MKKFIGLICVVASFNTFAAIYKQVDAEGRTVYTDQPPAGGKVKRIEVAPGPSASEVNAAVRAAETMKQGIDQRLADKALRQSALDREVARKRQALKEAEAALAAAKNGGGDETRGLVQGPNSVAFGGGSAIVGSPVGAGAGGGQTGVIGGNHTVGKRRVAGGNRGNGERIQTLEAAVQTARQELAIAEDNAREY